jgi:D-psicose/D-tagatose/L-ribulose 3-epimerase
VTSNDGRLSLGICMAPPPEALAKVLAAAGCDYYEPGVATAVMTEGEAEFNEHLPYWSVGGLEPKSANLFLPGEHKVVGPGVDAKAIRAYMAEALRRAAALGIERLVFGSGKAREVPDGFPREEAYLQLKQAARWACEAANAAGGKTVVCLEHLRRAETNIVNSLAEAGELVHELDLPNLALVVDGYHLMEEHEDVAVVREVADKVAHVHVCGPDRHPPTESDVKYLASLFGELERIGYRGRISIEASFADLESQAPGALSAVRHAAEVAGLG